MDSKDEPVGSPVTDHEADEAVASTRRRSTLAAEMQQELKRQVMWNWRVSSAEGIGWSGLPEGVMVRDLLVGVSGGLP